MRTKECLDACPAHERGSTRMWCGQMRRSDADADRWERDSENLSSTFLLAKTTTRSGPSPQWPDADIGELKLRRVRGPIAQFLNEMHGLGRKRGPLLVQLPAPLGFDARVAGRFFEVGLTYYRLHGSPGFTSRRW